MRPEQPGPRNQRRTGKLCKQRIPSKLSQVPKLSQLFQVPKLSQLSQVPKLSQLFQVPKLSQLSQVPKLSQLSQVSSCLSCFSCPAKLSQLPKLSQVCKLSPQLSQLPRLQAVCSVVSLAEAACPRMRGSNSDDADDSKVRKRRQQKRDYATRKRQHDKQLLQHLEMRNKELSRDSRRQKQVIQQLKAWATYAQSFLSLCCQLLTFRPPPSTPQGRQQSLGKSGPLPPQKAPAVQDQAAPLTEGREEEEGAASPGQSACQQHPEAEGWGAPGLQPQTTGSASGGGGPDPEHTTPGVLGSCLESSLMSPEADRRCPCPSPASSQACPDQSPSPEYLLVTDCVTVCDLSEPDQLYLLMDRQPLAQAVSQLCPVSLADYTWGQTLQDFLTDVTCTDDVTEPASSAQECPG